MPGIQPPRSKQEEPDCLSPGLLQIAINRQIRRAPASDPKLSSGAGRCLAHFESVATGERQDKALAAAQCATYRASPQADIGPIMPKPDLAQGGAVTNERAAS
ncbi:hypothetical protein SAMN05444161_8774 [Rhizobiales bacterium GAS191]|nr:hypothetical protein SAMN05444161_8774 [Rhizobiales bacterium GAS191]